MQMSPVIAVHMTAALLAVVTGPVALWARRGRFRPPSARWQCAGRPNPAPPPDVSSGSQPQTRRYFSASCCWRSMILGTSGCIGLISFIAQR